MNDDCVIWTGRNDDEVERFAKDNGFLIFVGANFYKKTRWHHRFFNYLKKSHVGWTGGAVRGTEVPDSALATVIAMLSEPRVDKDILEIHPPGVTFDMPEHWKTAKVGDSVTRSGEVIRK